MEIATGPKYGPGGEGGSCAVCRRAMEREIRIYVRLRKVDAQSRTWEARRRLMGTNLPTNHPSARVGGDTPGACSAANPLGWSPFLQGVPDRAFRDAEVLGAMRASRSACARIPASLTPPARAPETSLNIDRKALADRLLANG